MIVPGKQLLSDLNSKLQQTYGVSVTVSQIIRNLTAEETAFDLRMIFQALNEFAKGQRVPDFGEARRVSA